jgi:predicted PurR-regulated permease PerM
MNSNTKKWIIGFATFILFGLFVWQFYYIILYILIAGFLSLLGSPIVRFIEKIGFGKFRIPRGISALLGLIIVVGLVLSFVAIFIPIVMSQIQVFSKLDIYAAIENFKEPINSFEDFLINKKIISGDEPLEIVISNQFIKMVNFGDVESLLIKMINLTGQLFISTLTIILSTYFFLKDDRLLKNTIIQLTPNNLKERMSNMLSTAKNLVVKYFWGLILDATIVLVIISLGMYLIGVKNFLMLGLVAGVFNVIPYVGPLLSLAVGTFIGVTNELYHDPSAVNLIFIIKMLSVYAIVNFSDGFILQPYIFSKIVRAHPLEIFFVLIIAAQLGGIFGMIIAIPSYKLLRIIVSEFLAHWGISPTNNEIQN